MVLYVDGQVVKSDTCREYDQIIKTLSILKAENAALLSLPVQTIPSARLLYVNQREYAVVAPDDEIIDFIGSEDATTCHIIVIKHTGSSSVCLSHLDGWKTRQCVESLLKAITEKAAPEGGRIEVSLCGGFIDPKGESRKLTCEIMEALSESPVEVHLMLACISEYNDIVKDGIHFPIIYGIGVNTKQFSIFRAKFEDKGPDENFRSAAIFGGSKKLNNIYNASTHELVIGPYSWSAWEDVDLWLMQEDSIILKYLSTSPEQEPDGYVEHVRESLTAIRDHPDPMQSLFINGARRYMKSQQGNWTKVQ